MYICVYNRSNNLLNTNMSNLFKSIYQIELWSGVKTPFHKKYYVFDGLGLLFFDTLQPARSYVVQKSALLESLYNQSKTFYKKLSECYFDRLIKFRILDHDNQTVNCLLRDCLDSYRHLSKPFYPQYILSKLRYIYDCFLRISKVLKMTLLYKTIRHLYDSFYVPYPVYNSSDYKLSKQLEKSIQLKQAI